MVAAPVAAYDVAIVTRLTLVLIVLAGLGSVAAAEADPISPLPSKGYRDYCDGMKRGRCAAGHVPRALWRPLALPVVAPNQRCPVDTPHAVTHLLAPVLGRGPVYFSAGAYNINDRTTMKAYTGDGHQPSFAAGTGWGVAKAPFVMKKRLRQPLLVRGARIDGAGLLGFGGPAGHRPFEAMQFPRNRADFIVGSYKGVGGATWATASGCYAVQIDGKTFSEVIVFRVEVLS